MRSLQIYPNRSLRPMATHCDPAEGSMVFVDEYPLLPEVVWGYRRPGRVQRVAGDPPAKRRSHGSARATTPVGV